MMAGEPVTMRCEADAGFNEWLARSGGSVACTTYQAGKLLLIGWNGRQVSLLPRTFQKAMGLDVAGGRLVLATQHEVFWFADAPLLAPEFLPDQPNRYDALYLPRVLYFTGDLNVHDLALGTDGLWLVASRFSCLARLSEEYSFIPVWRPPFVSDFVPEDRCHLNGLALLDGQPKTVTVLGMTDTPGGWRANKATGGVLLDVPTGETILSGLAMPHSPRWQQERLWVLNSGTGELLQVDTERGQAEVVCALPGYVRGLTVVGNVALVGLCKIRERHIFGGLPVQTRYKQLRCGIALVDLQRGIQIGLFEFTAGVEEIYDLRFLPGRQRPNILAPGQPGVREGFPAPDFSYWLRPDKQLPLE
ncbi:MAG: TIGR03032 family protein [Candidatus Competibacteraceae bacterium]